MKSLAGFLAGMAFAFGISLGFYLIDRPTTIGGMDIEEWKNSRDLCLDTEALAFKMFRECHVELVNCWEQD